MGLPSMRGAIPSLGQLLRLPPLLLLGALSFSTGAEAAASVDVSLQATFPSPPLLLELLESAASENQSAYFPLVSTIATGVFHQADLTDQQLYERFAKVLKDEGHITDPAALASWRLALALRESAPRIEAHYQYWTTVAAAEHDDADQAGAANAWRGGLSCAHQDCASEEAASPSSTKHHSTADLQIDRTNNPSPGVVPRVVYADLTSPNFPSLFSWWAGMHGHEPYRIRYKPPYDVARPALPVGGYGVELALKRTDYIVIDDRESEQSGEDKPQISRPGQIDLDDETPADLQPLSTSELRRLSVNAASYIMSSQNPLDTLSKISQDFPKYAASLSHHNASKTFLSEHRENRKAFLGTGINVMWLNGQQIAPREVNAFSLLEATRRERKLIAAIQSHGLSPQDSIALLQHPAVAKTQAAADVQRYDFGDSIEEGRVVLWLNDIEKDKRYAQWSSELESYLQRAFPGQLPAVRRNAHQVVLPLDLSEPASVGLSVDMAQNFVKRNIPVRFGLVPLARDPELQSQVRVLYYLRDAYSLSVMLDYLEKSAKQQSLARPDSSIFDSVVKDSPLRKAQRALSVDQIIQDVGVGQRGMLGAAKYLKRLAATDADPPIFINGVPIKKTENWVQDMSQQVSMDLQLIQQAVFEGSLQEKDRLSEFFTKGASAHRDPLLIPEDPKAIQLFDTAKLFSDFEETLAPAVPFCISDSVDTSERNSLIVLTDLQTNYGTDLVLNATRFASHHPDIEVRFIQHPSDLSSKSPRAISTDSIARIQEAVESDTATFSPEHKQLIIRYLTGSLTSQSPVAAASGNEPESFASALGLGLGESGILLNGRLVGPLPPGRSLLRDDFETLFNFERKARLETTVKALKDMGLSESLKGPYAIAKLASTVALSSISDVPEGIFDTNTGPRMRSFNDWNSSATCITIGDKDTAPLQVVAALDPTSEIAQKWIPILTTLSELDGVYTKLFLNPKDNLAELPIKRFYRQALGSKPTFAGDGSLTEPSIQFAGIPENALLTMGLDVPPSWLVSPKESIHDLDNIKLSSLKGASKLEALYELESILIEGHSRDPAANSPPRGAQLNLATGDNPGFAGTIIMANLGYFQFKANPGLYDLGLKGEATQQIFSLDSAGALGYSPQPGDENTGIALHSFKGATIFPRLSRKPGQEETDVLDFKSGSSLESLASQGAEMADELAARAGFANIKPGDYIAKGFQLGQEILSMTGMAGEAPAPKHADINIFSVASGHLYERMLNIMTVSVMRHTNHTVKFWFIEQFLSPSFKTFLPSMAAEYGFQYEMVTFKWPHWLRAQTEKQRIIWGYKILFLDVLFPLDLDKVIFVDADQIVRTDMYELVQHDLKGAPYGFTPMCDSRTEMEGFRFWKQGYWANFLRGLPYHISALYVVDLKKFRAIAAGDRLRQQYQALSADPNSLSNLDQDLPNHMQSMLPIHSLPQEWLWCETWCSDESLKDARTIDLCNNPQTKEPKLDRARRQVPEWTVYDNEIAALAKKSRGVEDVRVEGVIGGDNPPPASQKVPAGDKEEL